MWGRAFKDTLRTLGLDSHHLKYSIPSFLIVALGTWIITVYFYNEPGIREIVASLLSAGVPVLVFVGVFAYKLIQAPVHIEYEKQKEPRLMVDGPPQFRWYGNHLGRSWRLLIKNVSTGIAEDCRGKLIEIAGEICGLEKGLSLWPTNEYLNWNTGNGSIQIAPNDIMELEILYWEGYGSPLYFAYAKGEDFRKQHALKSFNQSIILIICLTSELKSPVYYICKFHPHRVGDDNLELIGVTSGKPDIRVYQKQCFNSGGSES